MNKLQKLRSAFSVVMLANGHSPIDTRIFFKEAGTLIRAGYNVSLIVPHAKNEIRENVSIIAVPLTNKGWQKLLVNPWNLLRKAFEQPSNAVYHIHDSDILLVGIILKLLGRKVIYDAHEDTPLQIMYQHWLPGILKWPYRWYYYILERVCGWLFDKIIVAEPIIARYFPVNKTYVVRNFPIAQSFLQINTAFTNRKRRLVYVGTLTEARGLFEMLKGAQLAAQQVNFEFVLGGRFSPLTLRQKVLAEYNVTLLSWMSFTDMVDLLFNAWIGLIVPHPVKRYKTNYPVKLFEYMAAGLPVIASGQGESKKFVEEAQCGILVNPLNPQEIAEAIVWLFTHPQEAEDMGKRGRELILKKYTWEIESDKLVQIYDELFNLKK